ncbi:hypothetical protein SARC_02826 [Sphaeroforma arctica JP610]|uniref:Uncharacterized protein n=1 Tax=Sphaeroforma arctica JP610 TaxID=667725 RepID=A0A0L0G7U8_9EUKA|nr:hypothetical protein SARC_02826 [Sphaeroforma arctica JP610]KNC84971.1 hypothetical protein SARC_02826 [Sphaeroforma arctica JP610]|eukprot:XP_014158873.1 hypothetical protein SARC_02826 [Sphaeroforma arctica JP610]
MPSSKNSQTPLKSHIVSYRTWSLDFFFLENKIPVGSLGTHSPTTHRPQSHSLRKMSGQAESPTKALVPNDSLHNDQWKLDVQKSITDLSAQVNTLQANLNQMSGPALPTLDKNGPISKEPLADDQWKSTMHQILSELCAKVNNLESELRDLKSQTCAPLNECTPNTFLFGSTRPPAPPAKKDRGHRRPLAAVSLPATAQKWATPQNRLPKKAPISPTSQSLLQPPVPAHFLTKVMGRPMLDKLSTEMDDITPVWLFLRAIFPNGKPPS